MSGHSSKTTDQEGTESAEESVNANMTTPPMAQMTDRFGHVYCYGDAGDLRLPPFLVGANWDYRKLVTHIRDLEIRPDDILICTYPKSGTHWTHEIIGMLMSKSITYSTEDWSVNGFLDMVPTSEGKMQSPRVLTTHVPFRYLPRQAFQKKIKIIFLERNPKDVLVSYFNHISKLAFPMGYAGTFQQFFSTYFEIGGFHYGDLFDYLMTRQEGKEANPDVEIFTSVYEDMKRDPVGGVKKLNAYLNTGCSDEFCEKVAMACSFKTMKEFKDENAPNVEKYHFKSKQMEIFRKGDVGDWKNWFTVAMNEAFEEEFNKRMSDYKLTYTYTL